MLRAEAPRKSAVSSPVPRQARGMRMESPRGAGIAQLEALAQASPQVGRLARYAEQVIASPRLAAQRQAASDIQRSPRAIDQQRRLAGLMAGVAQREETPAMPNRTGLPDGLKNGVEALSGMAMDDVRVHYNSDRPARLDALAYAQGTDIHVGPGQEEHLPHEAWHVVQQAQGRVTPTRQMKGGVTVNDDAGLEREADAMGTKASQLGRQRGPAGSIASPGAGAGRARELQSVARTSAPVQMVPRTWAEADPILNRLLAHYRTMFGLLSDRGGRNRSTWALILERMNDMIDLQRQSARPPAGLQRLGRLAQECQRLVEQWKENHSEPLLIGKDAWTAKSAALGTLEPMLDSLSPSSGGLLTVPGVPMVTASASSVATAPRTAQSGIEAALAAEEGRYRVVCAAIAADRSRLVGKTKTREHVQVDTSKHLLSYANALAELGRKISNARASGDPVGDALIAAVQSRKAFLFEDAGILDATGWRLQVPDSYRLIFPEESREHDQRVATIRQALGDLNEILHPRKTKRGGIGEVAGEAAGDPLSVGLSVFGF